MTLDEAKAIGENKGFNFVRFSKGCNGCGIGDSVFMDHLEHPHLTLQLIKNKNLIGRFVIVNKSSRKPYLTGALNNIETILHETDLSVFE